MIHDTPIKVIRPPEDPVLIEIDLSRLRELRRRAGKMSVQNVPAVRAYGEGIEYALRTLGVWEISREKR